MREKCIYCGADLPLPEELTVHLCPEMHNYFKKSAQRTDDAYWLRVIASRLYAHGIANWIDQNPGGISLKEHIENQENSLARVSVHRAIKLLKAIEEVENATNSK